MLLRSGRIYTNDTNTTRRREAMANPPNNNEIPQTNVGTTVIPTVSEALTAGSTPTVAVTTTGPLPPFTGPRVPLGTPPPRGNPGTRPYVPPGFSTVGLNREPLYGMPTSELASLTNATSTVSDPLVSASSPLQGSGVGMANRSRTQLLGGMSQVMHGLTNASTAVMRQQIDESNHDMVQMLAQTLSTVLNPLIQNTTQSNQ